jgi:phosphoglycerate dehydrogenase-like enzyme
LLIAVSRRLVFADRRLRANDWTPRWTTDRPKQLHGQNALVLGYGALGQETARLLQPIGMQVSAISRTGEAFSLAGGPVDVYPVAELHDHLPIAHALVICLPGTPGTRGLIGVDELALLPQGALLVNVGRGHVVEEQALFEALRDGHLGGAGLDVWYNYPTDKDSRQSTPPSRFPFGELDNVVLSPHRSGHVAETERLRMEHLCCSLNAAARGDPVPHRVDVVRGY